MVKIDSVRQVDSPVNNHIKALDKIKKDIKEEVEVTKGFKEKLVKEMRVKEKLKKLFGLLSNELQKEITIIENESFLDKTKVHAFNRINELLDREKVLGFLYNKIFFGKNEKKEIIRYQDSE